MSQDRRKRSGLLGLIGIQLKFGIALTVLLLLFGLASLLFGTSLREVQQAREDSGRSERVLLDIEDLIVAVLNQETGLRGYLLSQRPDFLEPYTRGLSQFDAAAADLAVLTQDSASHQASLASLREEMRHWQQDFAKPLLQLDAADNRAAMLELILSGKGKNLIDGMRETVQQMRDHELRQLRQRAAVLEQHMQRTRQIVWWMLLTGIVFGALVIASVARHISRPLSRLTELMMRLTSGDTELVVPYRERGDELGALARGLEVFRRSTRELLDREWMKSRLGELSSALPGCHTLEAYALALLQPLSRDSGAVGAVLYRWNPQTRRLEFCGAYGVADAALRHRSFALGEGLIGQAAQDRSITLVTSLPPDFLPVRSGAGEGPPRELRLLPLVGKDDLVAVIELAFFATPGPREQEYLQQVLPLAALQLDILERALATQELLRQTQYQKEELQASEETLRVQQEELRATNDALREKSRQLEEQSQRLRASEEELRAQAEELRITNAALEEKSEALNAQKDALEIAQAELEEKAVDLESASRYKSEFLANMSHELRTPLNSLLILSKGLADNDEGNLNAEQIESARIVYDSGRNLLNLINDILDLSKVEAGKMQVYAEDVNLAALAAGIERNFRPMAADRRLGFEVRRAAGLPESIHSDGTRLNQILTNLLSNAFKFTHEGSVVLEIEAIASGRYAGGLLLRVRDSGIGIPEEKLARIFQAFEQADSGTSRRYGGTGLGLSIVKALADLLQGEIRVESEPGKGSTFTLLLPPRLGAATPVEGAAPAVPVTAVATAGTASATAATPSEVETVAQASGVPVLPPGSSILIIEDDAQFAEVLAGLARARQYRALVAHDGESGIALARQHRPGGILLDIGLPKMDGWQVMEQLKAHPSTAGIPVHFISGADAEPRARAAGAAGYLKKPVSKREVDAVLDGLPPPVSGARRVLIIDDSPADRRLVREMLRDEPVKIDEVGSGEAALDRIAQEAYDLLILDLGLPGIDGFQFLEQAAARGPVPAVVIHSGRELSREEGLRLREFTDTIVMKNAPSPQRLLDEVTLFLHSIRRVGAPLPAAPRVAVGEFSGRQVLVVDDDMRNIFALSKALRTRGLKVIMAQDGHKALAQLEANADVDLVLMDIMMPGMDGYETIRRIREREEWKTLPIIAVTAKAMLGDREKCIEAGANDYCSKPIDIDQLVGQMQQLLANG
jgi:CheY-like chemotaxis protein/signal transduction histidine kinase/CHASE3 domain sensor protein